jgi:hypothetical protein
MEIESYSTGFIRWSKSSIPCLLFLAHHCLSELKFLVLHVSFLIPIFCHQVPFEPAKAIFAGVDILIAVRTLLRFSAALPHDLSTLQAASSVSSSYDALVELFECLGNFLKRIRIYSDIPLTPSMAEISAKIMVELLSVLALATKQVKQGRFSKWICLCDMQRISAHRLRRNFCKEAAWRK